MRKMSIFYTRLGIFFAFFLISTAELYEGDPCEMKGKPGLCTVQDRCPELESDFYKGFIRNEEIPRCGYVVDKEVICCPLDQLTNNHPELIKHALPRAAERACRIITIFSQPELNGRFSSGNSVTSGEYPHMAAIGYQRFGYEKTKYDYACAGSLISEKFVLTAAHCLLDPSRQPEVVLLGTVYLDEEENGVVIDVKAHYLHSEAKSSNLYNDIGLIEMEHAVEFGPNIYPTCLYTDTDDPSLDSKLYVLGWGKTRTGGSSNKLLKEQLSLMPLDKCNEKILALSNRRMRYGVQNTQICAQDSERDSCNGDSGGPLLLIHNDSVSHYRVLGITSINCGGDLPGLYTRVTSYLNFIEAIVWPNSNFNLNSD